MPNFSKLRSRADLELSDLYEQVGSHQKSSEILHKIFDCCADADQKFELLLLEKMASVNFKLKNYQLSAELNEKLLGKLDDPKKETSKRAKILNSLAEYYYTLEDYTKSIKYFKEQLKIDHREGSADDATKFQRLDVMKKLSFSYKKTGQLDNTLKVYFEILNYSREVNNLDSQLWSFFNIGFCYYTNGAYAEAISIFQEYLALLDEADASAVSGDDQDKRERERLKIYHVLALIQFKMNDFKESFGYFRRDAALMEQLKEQLLDLNPNIDLDQLADNESSCNELVVCTKICCLLISPKAGLVVDDILSSFGELNLS